MKAIIISCLGAAAFVTLSACTTVHEAPAPARHSSTTTTQERTMTHQPVAPTTTTTQTRSVGTY